MLVLFRLLRRLPRQAIIAVALAAALLGSILALSASAQVSTSTTADPWYPVTLCESGGDPAAVSPSGTDLGLFQIQRPTQLAAVAALEQATGVVRDDLRRLPPNLLPVEAQYELAEAIRTLLPGGLSHWPYCGAAYAGCFRQVGATVEFCYDPVAALRLGQPGVFPSTAEFELVPVADGGGCVRTILEDCVTWWACPVDGRNYAQLVFPPEAYCTEAVEIFPGVPTVPNPQPSVPLPQPVPQFTG